MHSRYLPITSRTLASRTRICDMHKSRNMNNWADRFIFPARVEGSRAGSTVTFIRFSRIKNTNMWHWCLLISQTRNSAQKRSELARNRRAVLFNSRRYKTRNIFPDIFGATLFCVCESREIKITAGFVLPPIVNYRHVYCRENYRKCFFFFFFYMRMKAPPCDLFKLQRCVTWKFDYNLGAVESQLYNNRARLNSCKRTEVLRSSISSSLARFRKLATCHFDSGNTRYGLLPLASFMTRRVFAHSCKVALQEASPAHWFSDYREECKRLRLPLNDVRQTTESIELQSSSTSPSLFLHTRFILDVRREDGTLLH